MPVLMYSPGIRVTVETTEYGQIDLTEDLQSGSLTLRENAPSSFSFTLLNQRRKYDGVFTPNDIIAVRMKRLKWLPVFAGYLDQVPYFSVYPRSVRLTASDTLKRLKYRLWDSGAPESVELMVNAMEGGADDVDGGMTRRIMALMTQVADWPSRNIHIGAVPTLWASKTNALRDKLSSQFEVDPSILGFNAAAGGVLPTDNGKMAVIPDGKGTGALPASSGKVTAFGGPSGGVYSVMQLSKESGSQPRDEWYAAMRWPYTQSNDPSKPADGMSLTEYGQAQRWWANRKLLVVNRSNNRAVVVRAADWGPRGPIDNDQVIGLSKHALETALLGKRGDTVDIRFAHEDAQLGLLTALPDEPPRITDIPASPPPVIQGASGGRFTSQDNLQGNCHAARTFIKSNWQVPYGIGGYVDRPIAGTGTPSDHSKGLALDVMVSSPGSKAEGSDRSKGNAVALWFVENPEVFGTKYVIWMDRINSGSGWRPYNHPAGNTNTLQHRDHVHVSFKATGQTQPGNPGGGWPGSDIGDFSGGIVVGSGAPIPVGFGGGGVIGALTSESLLPLINAAAWTPTPTSEGTWLHGDRALMNDTPVLTTIKNLCTASMRSFMAAPNGDFIAWFPDFFGTYQTATRIEIKDIELAVEGFTMAWDDSRLITHQYAVGAHHGTNVFGAGGIIEQVQKFSTHGIATVELPELMATLFNVNPNDPRAASFLNPEAILQRFGARVDYQEMGMISGKEAEFWYACHLFQRNWAEQFSSTVNLTFMPEIWPGMLIHLKTFGFQAYVEQVTHTFDFSEGQGFDTSVSIIAPSATGGRGLYALPRAGVGEEIPPGMRKGGKTVL